jgi:hypothetical protein
MESHYSTTWPSLGGRKYALIRSPHKGLYVRVEDIDPIKPGQVLHVTDDELDALRYRRITIMGIIEGRHQDEIRKAKLEQMREEMRARQEEAKEFLREAVQYAAEAEKLKPIPVKLIMNPHNTMGTRFGSIAFERLDGQNQQLKPGTYTIEIKEVEILK